LTAVKQHVIARVQSAFLWHDTCIKTKSPLINCLINDVSMEA